MVLVYDNMRTILCTMLCNTLFLPCIDWSWSSFPVVMACQASWRRRFRRDFLPNLLHPKTCFNIFEGLCHLSPNSFSSFNHCDVGLHHFRGESSAGAPPRTQETKSGAVWVAWHILGPIRDICDWKPHYIRCSLERNILEYLGIMLSKADLYGPAAVWDAAEDLRTRETDPETLQQLAYRILSHCGELVFHECCHACSLAKLHQ